MMFTGTVTIEGQKSGRPSQRITLHQNGLKITSATITSHGKQGIREIEIDRINLQNSYNQVRLHAAQNLYPGKYTLTLEFSGKITSDMDGIYPCNFKHDGKAKSLIATQFESHYARKVFPCIDEPEAKAVFQLSLVTPRDEVVLSNTPAIKTAEVKGSPSLVRTTFEETPRMSTYLLAFVYGEMHSAKTKTKDGIIVQSWANVARPVKQLEYSAKEAADLLDFYSKYYDTPYPLAKLDQVALPDFDAGAMENWGLVTYREIALLTDPDNRSISQEQHVSLVVAHELAHQWFGNLVTMKWWDDLWLNESFASIMEHLSLDTIHPDWEQWELYSATDIPNTTSRDIYNDIQSVGVKIDNVALLETAFDPGIVYAKGARLLKMLREYIGDQAFSKGLKAYFANHAYTNTTREDLWDAMSEAANKNIHDLMTPWLTQPGMPVLRVEQNGNQVTVSQQRFALDVDDKSSVWPIPLLASSPLSEDILRTGSATFTSESDDYSLINQFGSGHYFTHYIMSGHREWLVRQVEAGKLPTETRINTLNDMLLLARRGDSSLTDLLELVTRMKHEERDNVWGLMARALASAGLLIEGDEVSVARLRQIRYDLAHELHARLGWDDQANDDVNTKQLRHTVLAFMIGSEDESTIAETKNVYRKAKSIEAINAEIRSSILSAVVRHGSENDAMDLLAQYEAAGPELQSDISGALASTKDSELARKILTKALGPKGMVRPQDVMCWLVIFLRNYYTREVAWDFLAKNYDWVHQVLSPGKAYDYLPVYCAGFITTKEWQKKYNDLFIPLKKHITLVKNITIGQADIEARIAWRERDEAKIRSFLQNCKIT